jgi:hypothetical protein
MITRTDPVITRTDPVIFGLLLVEVCKVFGDTWESVDEVNCPRFLFVFPDNCINFADK